MADTTSFTAAPVATSNVNSTADLATAATMAPRLYDRYPMWDGDFNSFENWLLAMDLPLSDPEMAPASAAPLTFVVSSSRASRPFDSRRDYNKWCTRAGHLAPTGAARIEIHKGGLIDSIRAAAATRGFKSDVEWDEYSGGSPDEIVQPTLVDLDAGCSGGRKVAGSGTPLVFPSAPSTSRK
ncbi:hypothetical protein E4U27_002112 [Claviceps purpurea]|nr:hypothetical protein E4U27_002112 [Claviceps purpurea]